MTTTQRPDTHTDHERILSLIDRTLDEYETPKRLFGQRVDDATPTNGWRYGDRIH